MTRRDAGLGKQCDRYFVLDFEAGILQYFVNEQSKHQKPRGALSLSGAIVSLSDEAPHMLVVYSANGEMYKLRAADAKEKQFWVTQLRACAKYHMETNSKVQLISFGLVNRTAVSSQTTPSSRSRSLTLLPHGTPCSASPCSQRHLSAGAPGVVTITHHKSPAAARRTKSQYSGQLHEVRESLHREVGFMPAVQMRTLMPRGATAHGQADADNWQQCQDASLRSLTWSPLPQPGTHKASISAP
ncbi:Oxysterol-binding protein-related protein 10 [Pteropus alecto]|uniref:Oxysterol-binding protein-related protein 10 n=1 Tax=Pteropus alecto TaxID=9402 RepID=L5L3G5_PTEAL|nr:Oxysterol-binding protein-related protein 10 [Pteropus alecto]